MSDLTPDNAKPGIKVRCVRGWVEVIDPSSASWDRTRWVLPAPQRLVVGKVYTIKAYEGENLVDCRDGEERPYRGNEGGVMIAELHFDFDRVFWELDRFEVIDETESSVQVVAGSGKQDESLVAVEGAETASTVHPSEPERRPSKPAYRPTRAASRRKIQRQGY